MQQPTTPVRCCIRDILLKNEENSGRGQPEKNYAVTLRMAEHFCVVHCPEVRDIYIAIRTRQPVEGEDDVLLPKNGEQKNEGSG